MRKAQMAVLRF